MARIWGCCQQWTAERAGCQQRLDACCENARVIDAALGHRGNCRGVHLRGWPPAWKPCSAAQSSLVTTSKKASPSSGTVCHFPRLPAEHAMAKNRTMWLWQLPGQRPKCRGSGPASPAERGSIMWVNHSSRGNTRQHADSSSALLLHGMAQFWLYNTALRSAGRAYLRATGGGRCASIASVPSPPWQLQQWQRRNNTSAYVC